MVKKNKKRKEKRRRMDDSYVRQDDGKNKNC
jgi:hypothetical protein